MKHYNRGGFYIQLIHCDGEYKPLIDPIRDKLNTEMNFANPGDHVPEAEHNNCTIKECTRAAFHHLPYKAIPRVMIQYLSMECTPKLNMFRAKNWNINLLQSSSFTKPTNPGLQEGVSSFFW